LLIKLYTKEPYHISFVFYLFLLCLNNVFRSALTEQFMTCSLTNKMFVIIFYSEDNVMDPSHNCNVLTLLMDCNYFSHIVHVNYIHILLDLFKKNQGCSRIRSELHSPPFDSTLSLLYCRLLNSWFFLSFVYGYVYGCKCNIFSILTSMYRTVPIFASTRNGWSSQNLKLDISMSKFWRY